MNLIYYTMKMTLGVAFRTYFRKIYVWGKENIPRDRRVIFTLNHPTACIEPLLAASKADRYVHVLLRGDAFLSKPVEWFLRQIRTIPIFRSRDGMSDLRKNALIMQEIKARIHNPESSVLVLAEGTSAHEKRLRRLQKGTARMAFDTYEEYGDADIVIIPTAVNYTDSHRFRSLVSLEFGAPVALADYLDLYKDNKARALKKLTADVQDAMRAKVIHIEDPEDDGTVNLLLDFNRNEQRIPPFPYTETNNELVREEYRIVENINAKSKTERLRLAAQTDAYVRRLKEYRTEDLGAARPQASNFLNWLTLFLLFPLHVIGLLWNFPPLRLALHTADKKSQEVKFHASIRLVVGHFAWLAWYLLWIAAAWIVTNWTGALATAVLMPALGRISLIYSDLRAEVSAAYSYNSLPEEEKKAVRKLRAELLNQVR